MRAELKQFGRACVNEAKSSVLGWPNAWRLHRPIWGTLWFLQPILAIVLFATAVSTSLRITRWAPIADCPDHVATTASFLAHVNGYYTGLYYVGAATLVLVLCSLSLAVFHIADLMTIPVFLLIVPARPEVDTRRAKYVRAFDNQRRKYFVALSVVISLYAAVTISRLDISFKRIPSALQDIEPLMLLVVFLAFGLHILQVAVVLRRKHVANPLLAKIFAGYVIAIDSLRGTYKTVFTMLFFFIIFSWTMVPLAGRALDAYSHAVFDDMNERYGYSARYEFFDKNRECFDIPGAASRIVSVANLQEMYSVRGQIGNEYSIEYIRSSFMTMIFKIATFAGFMAVGLPTVLNAFYMADSRTVSWRMAKAALKSFAIVYCVQVALNKFYYVDFNSTLGAGVAFMFLLTLFVVQQESKFVDR